MELIPARADYDRRRCRYNYISRRFWRKQTHFLPGGGADYAQDSCQLWMWSTQTCCRPSDLAERSRTAHPALNRSQSMFVLNRLLLSSFHLLQREQHTYALFHPCAPPLPPSLCSFSLFLRYGLICSISIFDWMTITGH